MPIFPSRRTATAHRALLLLAGLLAAHAFAGPAPAQDSAHFTVTPERAPHAPAGVVAPVSTTAGLLADGKRDFSALGAAMEPAILRNWFDVLRGSESGLVTNDAALTLGGSLRAGALDGAEVEILRLENGRFRTVRIARVAQGGHRPAPWTRMFFHGNLIPPGTTRLRLPIDRHWRDGAPFRIAVQAIDRDGRASRLGLSDPVMPPPPADRPRKPRYAEFVKSGDFDPFSEARSTRLSAPENVRAEVTPEGLLEVSWDGTGLLDRVALQGYSLLVSHADAPPDDQAPARLVFDSPGPAVQRGDLAILRATRDDLRIGSFVADTRWHQRDAQLRVLTLFPRPRDDGGQNWSLVPHPTDTPVQVPGTHYLTARLAPDSPLRLFSRSFDVSTGTFRQPPRTDLVYEVSVWLRAPEGAGTAALRFPKALDVVQADTGQPLRTTPLGLTPDWQRHAVRFRLTAEDVDRSTGIALLLGGEGVVDVDNMVIGLADAPPAEPAPEIVPILRDSGMGLLRSHGFIKTRAATYDMRRLLGVPAGHTTGGAGVGLAPFLRIAQEAGMDPWLQIEPHMSAAEWQGLVEFLAAPWDPATDSAATKPWAALRVAQGRTAPWTESFDRILFEIGNEMWNGLFRPWIAMRLPDAGTGASVSRGAMLGAYTAHVLDAMAQSPYWDALAPQLEPVIGGWAINPRFGADAARASAAAGQPVPHVGVAAYIGGWDEGEGVVRDTPQGYASVLAYAAQVAGPVVAQHRAALQSLAADGLPVPGLVDYEGGPGYALDGLNRARVTKAQASTQERVMKSHAAGAATLDSFLVRATEGTALLNFFKFGRGARWNSHATREDGGHAFPAWDWLRIYNTELRGEILQVTPRAVPRADIPPRPRHDALPDAPMIGLHALRNGDRLAVVAVSRRIPGASAPAGGEGQTRVRVDLPLSAAATLTRWSLTGDYSAHDIGGNAVRPVAEQLDLPDDPATLTFTLPAGSAQAWVFEGVRWQ